MQSTCLTGGLRLGVLGTAAALAFSAPLVAGSEAPDAGTAANRIGLYFDRTPAAEFMGVVVMGTEVLRFKQASIDFLVNPSFPAQAANTLLAGPTTGVPAAPTFRSLVAGDLPVVGGGLVPGSYTSTNLTVDAYGRITAASNGSGSISGSGTAGQVTFWTGAATLGGSTKFLFNAITGMNVNMAATGADNLTLGTGAGTSLTTGSSNILLGKNTGFGMTIDASAIAIGNQTTPGSSSVIIGHAVTDGDAFNIWIGGAGSTIGTNNVILSPHGCSSSLDNSFVVGSSLDQITTYLLGAGELGEDGIPVSAITISPSPSLGGDVSGADMIFMGGVSTGSADGGSVIIRTSPSSTSGTLSNTPLDRLTILPDGAIKWTGIVTASAPAVSPGSTGTIFYDSTLQKFRYSANGAAYADIGNVSGSFIAGRVPFASGASTLTDDAGFLFSVTNGLEVNRGANVNNLMIGKAAGNVGETGQANIFIGFEAGNAHTSSSQNTVVGHTALKVSAGCANNTVVGAGSMSSSTGGSGNVVIGVNSLVNAIGGGNGNIVLGQATATALSSGNSNIIIGDSAAALITTGATNIFLGHYSGDFTPAGTNNRMVIGSTSYPINEIFIGKGDLSNNPGSISLNATGARTTDIAGATLFLNGGRGTGTGVGGAVRFQTAKAGTTGSTQNALVTRLSILQDGAAEWTGITTANAPAVSAVNAGNIFYDSTLQKFRYSANGGAYADLVAAPTLTATQVGFGSAGNVLTGSSKLTWDDTNGTLTLAQGAITTAQTALAVTSTWNNGSTSFRGITLNVTNTASATTSRLLSLETGGTGRFFIRYDGSVAVNPTLLTGSLVNPAVQVFVPGHQNIPTGESQSFYVGASGIQQFATGNIASQRFAFFDQPAYAFVGASTITNAATLAIFGAPVAGTNATITNSMALWVQGGRTQLDGQVRVNASALTSVQAPTASTSLYVVQGSGNGTITRVLADTYMGTGGGFASFSGRAARGSNTAPTAVQLNDEIIHLAAWGYGATGYSAAARGFLTIFAAENWTDSAQGTRIGFVTTAPGTTTTTEKIRIWGDGGMQLDGTFTSSPGAGCLLANGRVIISPLAATGAVQPGLSFTNAANTAMTASTERVNVLFDGTATQQFATGAIGLQRYFRIISPTYSFVGASTIGDADTLGIDGPPTGGTNATLTQACAIHIRTRALTGVTTGIALNLEAPTGATNNWALNVTSGASRFLGPLSTAAATAGASGFNITPGVTPTAPVNGDLWATTDVLYARLNSATFLLNQAVFALTDGVTIAVDSALGKLFTVTLGGNRTIANPTNPVNGRMILFRLKQDATGTRTVTWDTAYQFTTELPAPTLSTAANAIDYVGFIYDSTTLKWCCLSYALGYS